MPTNILSGNRFISGEFAGGYTKYSRKLALEVSRRSITTDNEMRGVAWEYGTSRAVCYGASNLRCALPDYLQISDE